MDRAAGGFDPDIVALAMADAVGGRQRLSRQRLDIELCPPRRRSSGWTRSRKLLIVDFVRRALQNPLQGFGCVENVSIRIVEDDDVGGLFGHDAVHFLGTAARRFRGDMIGDVMAYADDGNDAPVWAQFDFAMGFDDLDVRIRNSCARLR